MRRSKLDTTPMLQRSFTDCDLEVRSDGRTIVGIAVPFNQPTLIHERGHRYYELFRQGSFAKTLAERGAAKVKLLAKHDRSSLPLGRALELREDAAGLYGEFRVSETRTGDEVLALVRDGALDGLSIGFRPVIDSWNDDRTRVERAEVRLDEVSVVDFPAYDGATITDLRSTDPADGREAAATADDAAPEGTSLVIPKLERERIAVRLTIPTPRS